MAKDYEDLCTDVVVPHLHQLVDTIDADHLQKVLVHEWVLGIENNWAAYHNATSHDSTFVARLTFWIHGLRDKFLRCESDRQAVALLNEVFDASTYGCLEYGANEAMASQIGAFCRAVDDWMGEPVLRERWAKFLKLRDLTAEVAHLQKHKTRMIVIAIILICTIVGAPIGIILLIYVTVRIQKLRARLRSLSG